MIRIYPTTESGLSYADYFIKLPASIFPMRNRPQKIATTLSGAAVVTRWAKSQTGAQQTVSVRLSEEEFEKLASIIEHETVKDWVVVSLNRRYKCTIDMAAPELININQNPGYSVAITFTVLERLTT